MSHFYARIQGSRGEATRQGTERSGIRGHLRGWDIGAHIECSVDSNGNDVVFVGITGGTNCPSVLKPLGVFRASDIN